MASDPSTLQEPQGRPERGRGTTGSGSPRAQSRGDKATLPARRSLEHKQVALQSALQVLASGSALDRPDTPDEVVTAVRRLPAVEAAYAPFPAGIDPRLRAAFEARGVQQLYTHQAEAFDLVSQGEQVVVTTPTASGKTLCYNLPVLDRILKNPATRALYLFPTKALAQDQMAELHELVGAIGNVAAARPRSACTPTTATRRRTRGAPSARAAHIVLSNPDMVHSGILPHHPRWAKLFENLQFIVIDELHAYRGVFGSHLANVLRRLQRICRHYGSNPQFICSSATIANPSELAERLAERPFCARRARAARRGARSSSCSSIRRSSIASWASGDRTSPNRGAWPASSCAATCR